MNEENILKDIDEMVEKWGEILIPIYTNKEFHDNTAQLLGTAFLAEFKKDIFLVTAHHVIKEHSDKPLTIIIGGRNVTLSKMIFSISEDYDIAISRLEKNWGDDNNIGKIKAIPLEDSKEHYKTLNRHFLLGFPTTKNTLNQRIGKISRNIQGTSFIEKIESPKSKTHIGNPLAFQFDKKNVIKTSGEKANPPKFNGNSGGPILELVSKNIQHNHKSIGCKLSGIFIGWHKEEKEVIATRPEALHALIYHLIKGVVTN
jgi:hypothetical protein